MTNYEKLIISIIFTAVVIWKGEDIYNMIIKPKYAGINSPYDDIIEKYAKKYNLDPLLIRAVIRQESNWKSDVIGFDGLSIGLMQITKPLAHDFFYSLGMVYQSYNPNAPDVKFSDFNDADTNIMIGAWKLHSDMLHFKGDLNKVLDSYNMGRGNVEKGLDITYSDSVLNFYSWYKGEKG
jgi:soluble lytic murein transglycosylase